MSQYEQAEAEEMLRTAIAVGPWPVAALKEIMAGAGLSEWHVKRAVADLTAQGELVLITQKFWASPHFSFEKEKSDSVLWVDGHSRAEMIRRLDPPAPSAPVHTAIESIMQGEDAERLAAQDYAHEVESWRG